MITKCAEFMVPLEASFSACMLPNLLLNTSKGDGHSVIVLPGFCAGKYSTAMLRNVINYAGYNSVDWGLGINFGTSGTIHNSLLERILFISAKEQVTLVGWSLGGLYARAIANQYPDNIRRVITLGTPHHARHETGKLSKIFDTLSPAPFSALDDKFKDDMKNDPPVPLTSIYTKMDGVVNWRDCISHSSHAENIEVCGSHMGLTHNYRVMQVILNRLDR